MPRMWPFGMVIAGQETTMPVKKLSINGPAPAHHGDDDDDEIVKCLDCAHEQPDMGKNVACENCGGTTVPIDEYDDPDEDD